jgi:hypothetical protein
MAVDKVKPLGLENSALGGTEDIPFPTEISPSEDYIATKGIAFENTDTFLIDKIGRSLVELHPDLYQNITYTGVNPTVVEYFNNPSFITANRIARRDNTFTSNNLTSEVLVIYDTNGTTILRTYTWTHTYTGSNLTSSVVVIT